jgi:hypothetical protein
MTHRCNGWKNCAGTKGRMDESLCRGRQNDPLLTVRHPPAMKPAKWTEELQVITY